MGHLINPVAFRLTFFKSWEDTWFTKNVYYPEFLNGMLKLRNYLYFFLTGKKILKSGIFLSSFFIIKYNKIYVVNVYIYHIDFERLSYECINRLYSSFFSYNRNHKIKKSSNFYKSIINNMDVYFFLILSYKMLKRKYKKKNKKYLNLNLFFKSNDFKDYYKKLLVICNELVINKFLFKNQDSKNEARKVSKFNKVVYANYSKFLFKNKIFKDYVYKSYKSNVKLSGYEKKKIGSGFNFTSFEFIMYLLKKVGFSFKNKIFNKAFQLKRTLSFLCAFKYLNYKFVKIRQKYNFLLYYLAVLLKSIFFSLLVNKKRSKSRIRSKIYFLLYNYLGYKYFFKGLKIVLSFLNNIFFIVNKIRNVSYKIFFLSNKNITARWLCRYIGLKLRNNFSFFSVINPIKRELYKLCRLSKKINYNRLHKFNAFIKRNNIKYKLKFKKLIKSFFLLNITENFIYYINNNNYVCDLYIFFLNKKKKDFDLNGFVSFYKYVYINTFINYYWELNLLKKQKIICGMIYKIYNFVLTSLDSKFNLELKKFYISAFFIKNLLKFNYFKYVWLQIKQINLRNERSKNILRHRSVLVGFKLAFKGRFSRKQRASDIWYMRGKVPLNTLSIKLDYFFFTIPIKNSAISIKIILYKNLYIEKFKYSLNF